MTKVDLVTGFLGAGKTTFLARYGDWLTRRDVRFAVIENEFGAAGVDRAILSERFGNVGELSGGCICCTLKLGFHDMLARLSGQCDRVIVEPSGLFNMDDFFEVVDSLTREGLCESGMCLTLIDPHTLSALDETEQSVLQTELTGAGAVLWTKVDVPPVCDLEQAARFATACMGLAGERPLAFYPQPAHLLVDKDFAALQQAEAVRRTHRRVVLNHTALYQSTALRPKGVFARQTLLETLESLISSGACGEILRVKGFLNAETGTFAVNCTVSDRLVESCAERTPMLNVIGRNLDRTGIKTALERISE